MKRIQVYNPYDSEEKKLYNAFLNQKSANCNVHQIQAEKVFWLEERESGLLEKLGEQKICKVFCDPIVEKISFDQTNFDPDATYVQVCFLPGVTDNLARTATEALMILNKSKNTFWQDFGIQVHSGLQIKVKGDVSKELIEKIVWQTIANPLLHKISIYRGDELQKHNYFMSDLNLFSVNVHHTPQLKMFNLDKETLNEVNRERGLALEDNEIEVLIQHFKSVSASPERVRLGWGGKITEVELEFLSQTWSEHCKHKIFAAEIEYEESGSTLNAPVKKLGSLKINSLYKSYIQRVTRESKKQNQLVSVFSDNAGIVNFDSKVNLCIKVETHNSPSALDPFGGAITGVLGVYRDIMGTGLGAKPIAGLDVFCLSKHDLFFSSDSPQRPKLLKDPKVIFNGVHQGVEEGGNQSGVPTVNGSMYFASEFAAKPLIFVGAVGVMPKTVGERKSEVKEANVGDKIIVAGGRVGKDGVHGATFSSLALQDQVSSNVVQIGDSITQKRLIDFLLIAREKNLIQAVTDNGAGGISSSVGEMSQLTGGAKIDLAKHLVKYPGLEFWEILVSESQERMTFAVESKNEEAFLNLAKKMSVEAFTIGEFTDTGYLEVFYEQKKLAILDLHFAHKGLPQMKLKAEFNGPQIYQPLFRKYSKKKPEASEKSSADYILHSLEYVLQNTNVASKEELVRYYDHEVQGATLVKPFSGKTQKGPNNSGVISLSMHGGESQNAVAIAHGICPQYSYFDTYLMAQKAADEAFRNLICVGADPDQIVLVDNFCWPDPISKDSNPDAKHKLAQLVRACEGLYQISKMYEAPLVSGKDSMKNDFIGETQEGKKVKISVPPTLLVTAMGRVPDQKRVITTHFKNFGDKIYYLGKKTQSLYGSAYEFEFDVKTSNPEYLDLTYQKQLFKNIFKAIQNKWIESCHDVSDGGMLSCVAEACFGNMLGAELNLNLFEHDEIWSETGSQFVVSVNPLNEKEFLNIFPDTIFLGKVAGKVSDEPVLELEYCNQKSKVSIQKLSDIWSKGVMDAYSH